MQTETAEINVILFCATYSSIGIPAKIRNIKLSQLSLIRLNNQLVKAAGIFSTANHSAEAEKAVKHRASIDKRISI